MEKDEYCIISLCLESKEKKTHKSRSDEWLSEGSETRSGPDV